MTTRFIPVHGGKQWCWHKYYKSMGECKKDVTPLLTHWSYFFLALTYRNVGLIHIWYLNSGHHCVCKWLSTRPSAAMMLYYTKTCFCKVHKAVNHLKKCLVGQMTSFKIRTASAMKVPREIMTHSTKIDILKFPHTSILCSTEKYQDTICT